jgi:hypothetical protein
VALGESVSSTFPLEYAAPVTLNAAPPVLDRLKSPALGAPDPTVALYEITILLGASLVISAEVNVGAVMVNSLDVMLELPVVEWHPIALKCWSSLTVTGALYVVLSEPQFPESQLGSSGGEVPFL